MANGPSRALDAATSHTGDYPTYASDSTSKFNPLLFSKKVLKNFYLETVTKLIANTDYEGEIKGQGDQVIIRRTPAITISDYAVGQDLDFEVPEIANRLLNIDQAKSWAFRLDSVDRAQSDLNLMNMFANDAGRRMQIAIDADVLDFSSTLADASNQGLTAGAVSGGYNLGVSGTPLASTSTNAVDNIVYLNAVLDEADIQSEGRVHVFPTWYCAMIKLGDLKQADLTGDTTGLIRTGVIGEVDNAMIVRSNNLKSVVDGANTAYYCLALVKDAITFASQITEAKIGEMENTFGMYNKGLQVYGRQVVQPTAMAMLYTYKG